MRRRLASAAAALSFIVLLVMLIWQGSFRISYSPADITEAVVLWAVSTLIFLLTLFLAFWLFRAGVKAYIERHRNKEGSRLRSKLLFGALFLTLAPVFFSVVFSVYVLNRHLDAWFSQSALQELDNSYKREVQERVQAETDWISLLPQTRQAAATGRVDTEFFRNLARQHGIRQIVFQKPNGVPLLLYQFFGNPDGAVTQASADIKDGASNLGRIHVTSAMSGDPAAGNLLTNESAIAEAQAARRKFYKDTYFRLILLVTLFVLFFAAWSALLMARQISTPISALLGAAREVRRGNLSYRIRVNAMDELATLVRAFNEMTNDLEGNARELEARRRFTEAILESIPTGVISVSTGGRIERVNRALAGIFSQQIADSAKTLDDLFSGEDLAEVRYLMKRARRTGVAAGQIDIQRPTSVFHLAVTVASLQDQRGFVMVIEDTSDLLRAQRAAAWQEVARRVAHEIKNPLTPISLSADRMARQLSRIQSPPEVRAILEECTQTIQQEVQTVKSLVDEFSQFSRFPSAQPVPTDLNEIVDSALTVFAGRLDNISVVLNLDRKIPPVMADREQMKRLVVNLIDNAAEAMSDTPIRKLVLATSQPAPDTVEFSVTDSGPGISADDKEKLFLPYFSTKQRGTGLGLAIVSHIISEHQGRVRVEDNYPTGARFVVELSALPQTQDMAWSEVVEAVAPAKV